MGKFFSGIKSELKKVVWPTKEQTAKSTATVIAFIVAIGAIMWIFDFALQYGILKLADILG